MRKIYLSCQFTVHGGDELRPKSLRGTAVLDLDDRDGVGKVFAEFQTLVARMARAAAKTGAYYSKLGWELSDEEFKARLDELAAKEDGFTEMAEDTKFLSPLTAARR